LGGTVLQVIPLFSNLSNNQLASIGAHSAIRAFDRGAVILREGDVADSVYVIVAGQVKVYIEDKLDPSREVILKTLKAGDFFGELPLFDAAPRNASVAALEPCQLQVLSYRAFKRAIQGSPDIAHHVMSTLANRLRHANQKITSLALLGIHGRVSRTLMELAIMSNGRRVVGEPFTQKDLASMIGASREMVNRTLQDLQDDGFISVHRKSITILDDRLALQH
jgi:CRP/FNR family transcriptional regulator, cyclic AMP receptor protein